MLKMNKGKRKIAMKDKPEKIIRVQKAKILKAARTLKLCLRFAKNSRAPWSSVRTIANGPRCFGLSRWTNCTLSKSEEEIDFG